MADKQTPNMQSNKDKAEGERWGSDENSVENADRASDAAERGTSEAGGITNRPLEEEMANQDALPERGESRIEHAGNKDVERDDTVMPSDDPSLNTKI